LMDLHLFGRNLFMAEPRTDEDAIWGISGSSLGGVDIVSKKLFFVFSWSKVSVVSQYRE